MKRRETGGVYARPLFRAVLAALAAALLVNVAMPGLAAWRGFAGLLPFCLIPLLLVVVLAPRRAALCGFLFGFCSSLGQLSWLTIVLGRYGGLPSWQGILVLLLLCAYMALYPALTCLLLAWLGNRAVDKGQTRCFALGFVWAPPLLWTGFDALRGLICTGFSWMDLGYGLFRVPFLLLPASLGGHHLLSFTLVLVNALVAFLVFAARKRAFSWPQLLYPSLSAVFFVLALLAYAWGYRSALEGDIAGAPRIKLAYVQGNIAQDLKWTETFKHETVARYLRLSRGLIPESPEPAEEVELFVWPETALPFYPQNDPLIHEVAELAAGGPRLLVGAPLYERKKTGSAQGEISHFNSALLLGPTTGGAKVEGLYHKQRLVPFGEYVPLRRLLFFLQPVAANIGDFTAGRSAAPLVGEGKASLGVLICYESVFPAVARVETRLGATLLANITNDAWYGRSNAPVQTLAMACLRAVENKRSLVRSANTGISAFINPLGQIRGESALFVEAARSDSLPLLKTQTPFTRGGCFFGLACTLATLLLLLPGLSQLARANIRGTTRAEEKNSA